MRDSVHVSDDEPLFTGAWTDGRPKRWPTMQLRIRGRGFDVYCEDPTDVTLDGYGIPVLRGRTASHDELSRGWMSTGDGDPHP